MTTNLIVKTDSDTSLPGSLTREQFDLLKRTLCKDLTDDEFKIFSYQVNRTQLDPFSRQIHAIKRAGKLTIQTGIDGFRLIAHRTGQYAGNDDPVFDDEKKPRKASVTVYRLIGGIRCSFTASARWEEYCPSDNQGFMWKKMPCLMLGKTAEGLALRKAFPAELSGLYTDVEMDQAEEKKRPTVFPEQPAATDGVRSEHETYKVDFGKFKGYTLHEIDAIELRGYIEYIESKANKEGKQITGNVLDFIERAKIYLESLDQIDPDLT